MGKKKREPAQVTAAEGSRAVSTAEARLKAAQLGWGVTARYGILGVIDRWRGFVLGSAAGATSTFALAYARSRGWIA